MRKRKDDNSTSSQRRKRARVDEKKKKDTVAPVQLRQQQQKQLPAAARCLYAALVNGGTFPYSTSKPSRLLSVHSSAHGATMAILRHVQPQFQQFDEARRSTQDDDDSRAWQCLRRVLADSKSLAAIGPDEAVEVLEALQIVVQFKLNADIVPCLAPPPGMIDTRGDAHIGLAYENAAQTAATTTVATSTEQSAHVILAATHDRCMTVLKEGYGGRVCVAYKLADVFVD